MKPSETDRRTFIKSSLLTPAAMALAAGTAVQAGAQEQEATPAASGDGEGMPCGKIGNLQISRMLLGGNLLTHFTHSRDLKYVYRLTENYNTEEKIIETLALSEQHGVNALVIHTVPWALEVLRRHRRENGGKMQWIICPTAAVAPGMDEYRKSVEELVNNGTEAIYLWGVHGDRLVDEGKIDLINEAVEVAKEFGVPSGVGGHDLRVIEACEENGIEADFYIKTFHHHKYPSSPRADEITGPYNELPGYWCSDPEKTAEVMAKVKKPWIAFKVMAAGAIPPKDAFQYVFDHGADHMLAGMFDFEIEEDVKIAKEALANCNRTRPWFS